MSRLNQQNSINYGNKETHIFTEFGNMNRETTQQQVLEAIKNINLNVGEIVVGDITVESSDTLTHTKLDTLNTTLTNKHLSSSTDTVGVSGSVSITGTPSVNATISGTPSVNATISGTPTVTVGNASLAVTGTFFPETQTVSISGTPSVNATITGTPSVNATITGTPSVNATISGTPSVNATITGTPTVTVGNASLAVTGTFFPETQTVSISGTPSVNATISGTPSVNATITGTPTVTVGNASLAVTGTFFPETQTVSISGTPTVTVGNASLAVTGTFFPETQTVSISGTPSVNATISGTPSVNATISGTPSVNATITGTPSVNATISGTPTVTVGNASLAVTGSVGLSTSENTIKIDQTGTNNAVSFASGSTVGLSTSANTIKIDSSNNAISGTVTIQGSDYATPETLNKVYVDANGFITTNSLTTQHENILLGHTFYKDQLTFLSTNSAFMVPDVNSSLNIPSFNTNGWCYRNLITANACNGSLFWYNNGPYGSLQSFPTQTNIEVRHLDIFYVILQNYYPATQSKIQMNVYTKTTGTGDFSVNYKSKFNYTVSGSPYIAMGQSYMIYNGQLNRVKLNDPEVPRVLYSLNSNNSQGLQANTEIISHIELLFTSTGGDTFLCNIVEGGLYSQNGHLVNYYFDNDLKAKNEFINLSTNTNILGALTFEGTDLQTISKISNGTNTADVFTTLSNNLSSNGLVCNSIIKAWNVDGGTMFPLTSNLNGNKNQLEVRDNDALAELTSIDTKSVQGYNTTNTTIGGYNTTGLNVYQILPKTKSFAMAGTNPNGSVADTLLGGTGTTLRVDTTSFGYANQKTFYAYIPSSSTLRTIAYTYVNSSGSESSTATAITANNTYTTLFTGCGINEVKFNGNVNPGASDLVYITINNSAIVNNVGSLNIRNHYNGVFTCPSNAIAVVTSLDYNMSTAGEQLFMNIYDSSGARSSIYAGFFYQTGVNNFRASPDGIGRIIQPLESVCFSTSSTAPTAKYLYYTVLVKYF